MWIKTRRWSLWPYFQRCLKIKASCVPGIWICSFDDPRKCFRSINLNRLWCKWRWPNSKSNDFSFRISSPHPSCLVFNLCKIRSWKVRKILYSSFRSHRLRDGTLYSRSLLKKNRRKNSGQRTKIISERVEKIRTSIKTQILPHPTSRQIHLQEKQAKY